MRLDFSEQHPIWKAGFFLQRAEECSADELAAFEAYLQAAIVFGRSAIQWTQRKHEDKSNPEWQKWWKSLLKDPSIKFFKDYRDDLLHERPPKVDQRIKMYSYDSSATRATELYYFEDRETPATKTVRRHLEATKQHVVFAEEHFADSPSPLP